MRNPDCSNYGKADKDVEKLAAGPGGLHICNECVEACHLFLNGVEVPIEVFDPHTWRTERPFGVRAGLGATAETIRQHLANAVDALRERNMSWTKIAEPLAVSRQSVWERFA
ncbi:ClpX C4-type zinc finger protein [Aliiroseovarius sp. S1339]|uniref:ClpX C4-type zinc finger protein n=1 Tax=Aliiroseovarius sp. S1339 TaxID=2936990 RepID=UPI0020C10914|nr:ClpX C4-type zinc finger protein [Aliiroseovarius sp. S1339]MCK8463495.1 ClpX C4-type zinc finger protein [Aliiroseovarius sp. S1339]